MQKIVRSFALVAVLAVSATPIYAGVTGCNPRPQTNATTSPILSAALTVLGL